LIDLDSDAGKNGQGSTSAEASYYKPTLANRRESLLQNAAVTENSLTLDLAAVPSSSIEFFTLRDLGGKISEALDTLRGTIARFPNLPWEIGFSGGKDSSIVCHLAFEYLKQARVDGSPVPPKVIILYSDTLLDVPILRRNTLSALKDMRQTAKDFGGLVEVNIVKPAKDRDYFSMVIDQGYSAPHFRYRWCIDRLKLAPSLGFLHTIGDYAMVTGVRKDESATRNRNMATRKQNEPISVVSGTPLIAPLLNWTQTDVWNFLSLFRQPWNGMSYEGLFEVYRLGDNLEGCGRCSMTPNSRFGCWICTVVRKDRLLTNLATRSLEYKTMLTAKERIRKISMTPALRSYTPEGRYKGINEEGRLEIINIMADVILTCDTALEAYLEDEDLRFKIIGWLTAAHSKSGNPNLAAALQKISPTVTSN